MSYIEVQHDEHIGWFCNNDLILVCDRETFNNENNSPFMDDNKLQSIYSSFITRKCRRHIPKLDFNDEKLFPSRSHKTTRTTTTITNITSNEINLDEELISELNSMLDCREYVSKQNHFFDRKQFQQAQAAQADQEKKLEEFKKRQQEQSKIERQQRRRQHPLYVSRFDEKRYQIREKLNYAHRDVYYLQEKNLILENQNNFLENEFKRQLDNIVEEKNEHINRLIHIIDQTYTRSTQINNHINDEYYSSNK
ncbi:unnamed protein product [Rotaria sp. Silwood1]|nr:unnamed protein product [Rotaria sp. Silwood1]